MTGLVPLALDGVLIAGLLCAVVTDVRSRRISNHLTYSLMALGLLANGAGEGWGGLRTSVVGCLLGAAILLVPWVLGGMGAGDLKLMAAIGALQGPQFVVVAAVYTGLAGGVLAVMELVRLRELGPVPAIAGGGQSGALGGSAPRRTIAYGPAIGAGALVALLLSSWKGA